MNLPTKRNAKFDLLNREETCMQRAAMTEEISRLNRCAQPDMTEQEAIVQAQNGDAAAFEYCTVRIAGACLRSACA